MISACCFDLGNTLNNDLLLTERSVAALGGQMKEAGLIDQSSRFEKIYHKVNQHIQKPFYSHTFGELEFFETALAELNITGIAPTGALEMYRKNVVRLTENNPDIRSTMEFLKAKNIKRVILSNERSARVDAYLESTGLRPLFDAVIVSESVGSEKPNLRIFHETLRRLQIPADQAGTVLMFGDNSIADGACTLVGMHFVLVTGYRDRKWYFEKGDEYTPEFEIEEISPEAVNQVLDFFDDPAYSALPSNRA